MSTEATKTTEPIDLNSTTDADASQSPNQSVIFVLGAESYGIDIFRVNEIIRMREITSLPRVENHIRGLVNLRGKTIPVIALGTRLGLSEVPDTESTRIIVVDSEHGNVGIVVDAVREVVTLDPACIDATPSIVQELSAEFVRGVAKHETGLITLLELDKAIAA